jgi:hypothetical protein
MNRDIFAHSASSRGPQDYLQLMEELAGGALSLRRQPIRTACLRSANDDVRDLFEAGDRNAYAAMMADAIHDLAAVVHLAQFALGLMFVTTVDHQVIHNHAHPRLDTKCIFHELVGMHENPFTSMKSLKYMQ